MRTLPASKTAARARTPIEALQTHYRETLTALEAPTGSGRSPEPVEWLRDDGRHGGGVRFVLSDTARFDRASLNVSIVHYDDIPEKKLGSATALSCIVHPAHPLAPSMHMHISWTEMRDGRGTWRVMADLNPSNPVDGDTETFRASLEKSAGEHFEAGTEQGDRYFFIPALGRHRGVVHFYLEGFSTGDFDADLAFAMGFGRDTIDTYASILARAFERPVDTASERAQLEYHTLYLFQVLTLDRGTTSGLLVHDQNDVGILGSLPSHVDGTLLRSWGARSPALQRPLVARLADHLGAGRQPVTVEKKRGLAATVRDHYRTHPEALNLQARGNVIPPTVANHRD